MKIIAVFQGTADSDPSSMILERFGVSQMLLSSIVFLIGIFNENI
jgi:predicted subunit of tRNA(5-methylaminomethyl-2-thiouridylate) methyltransferase